MQIALVNSTPKAKIYPLGLMKISAMLKSQGHKVKLFECKLPAAGKFDEIWISTLFTFDIPVAIALIREAKSRAKVVKVGGIAASLMPEVFRAEGVEVHIGQIPEAEKLAPDYDLLPGDPEYSITHTSRGCIRKCGFCMVPVLEPKFKARAGWEKDLSPKTTKVRFFDNNWLAKSIPELKADVAKIRALIAEKKITEFDFNQAIDCRIMTEEKADIIQGLPFKPLRFAFDGMHEDGYFQRSIEMCKARGFYNFNALMLYNFNDTPEDFYYRMRECTRLNVVAFPMKYAPVMDLQAHKFIGKNYNKQMIAGIAAIIPYQSVSGQVSQRNIPEFEYWWGKDEKEFIKFITYPGIRKLCQRKKAVLRTSRREDKNNGGSVDHG